MKNDRITPEEFEKRRNEITKKIAEYTKTIKTKKLTKEVEEQECTNCKAKGIKDIKELTALFQKGYDEVIAENTKLKGDNIMADDKALTEKDAKNLFQELINDSKKSSKLESNLDNIATTVGNLDKKIGNCKGGKCMGTAIDELSEKITDLPEIRKGVAEISELKKDMAEFKKSSLKREVCDNCGQLAIVKNEDEGFFASHCSNCGEEVEGWDEAPTWKPYNKRHN